MDEPNKTEKSSSKKERSFSVSLEHLAQMLRAEVKLKDRETKVLPTSSSPGSLNNTIMQVAKMLRTQVKGEDASAKRSWNVRKNSE